MRTPSESAVTIQDKGTRIPFGSWAWLAVMVLSLGVDVACLVALYLAR